MSIAFNTENNTDKCQSNNELKTCHHYNIDQNHNNSDYNHSLAENMMVDQSDFTFTHPSSTVLIEYKTATQSPLLTFDIPQTAKLSVLATFYIKDEYVQEFKQKALKIFKHVLNDKDCISLDYTEHPNDRNIFLFYEVWKNHEKFEQIYMKQLYTTINDPQNDDGIHETNYLSSLENTCYMWSEHRKFEFWFITDSGGKSILRTRSSEFNVDFNLSKFKAIDVSGID